MKNILKISIISLFLIIHQSFPQWEDANNGINGASVQCVIKVDNKFLAGTAGGGIYQSDETGNNWKQSNNGIENFTIISLASKGDTIIASCSFTLFYISYDKGENWTKHYIDFDSLSNMITIDNSVCFSNDSGFYMCVNNLYFYKLNTLTNKWIKREASPAPVNNIKLLGNVIYCSSSYGIIYSIDNCQSWEYKYIENGLIFPYLYVDNELIIMSYNYNYIIYSTDNGENWIKFNTKHNYPIISISRINNSLILTSYIDIYRINNFKDTFKLESLNKPKINHQYSFIEKNNIFLYGNVGVIKSTDLGESWQKQNDGFHNTFIRKLLSIENKIYAVSMYFGLFSSINNGDKWNNLGLDTNFYYSISAKNDYVFAGTELGLYYSKDKGINWNYANLNSKNKSISDIIMLNTNVYCAVRSDGIYRSTDLGETWEKKSSGLFAEKSGIDLIYLKNKFYTRTYFGDTLKVCVSKDSCNTWKQDPALTDNFSFSSYYIENDTIIAGYTKGMLKISYDGGTKWQEIKTNIKYTITGALRKWNNIFLSTGTEGNFFSSDNGETWRAINDGLSAKESSSFAIDKKYVYIATKNGVFRSSLSNFGITSIEEPKTEPDNYLYSFPAYPVPSNNGYIRAKIYWDNKDNIDNANITITNSIGEIISTENRITLDKSGTNNGTLNWNYSGEPKGAYFIKIQHGDKSNTLKVIVE